jgi:hypothetical protein
LRVTAEKGKLFLSARDAADVNAAQNGLDYTSFDQLLTGNGFPFTVDHDTNYVKYGGAFGGPGGEYGGIPQHWHIQYCKGEKQNKSAKDLGYVAGWNAKYWAFDTSISGADGFDSLAVGTPVTLTKVDKDIKFTHACSYGFKKDGRDVCSHMRVEWSGKLEIDREGDYEFRLCSDDGSRLFLNDN